MLKTWELKEAKLQLYRLLDRNILLVSTAESWLMELHNASKEEAGAILLQGLNDRLWVVVAGRLYRQ